MATKRPSSRSIRRGPSGPPAILAAALVAGGCGPAAPLPPPPAPAAAADHADPAAAAWFTEITGDAGVAFIHAPGATGDHRLPEITGGGVALFDADGDDDLDLYLVNSGPLARADGGAVPPGQRNALYRQDAPGRFTDVSAASGLDDDGFGQGVAIGDADGDGRPDVYVTNLGPDRLFRNRGDGTFEDVTAAAGLGDAGWGLSAAFLDHDADGDLDLFVARYLVDDPAERCFDPAGRPDYCGPKAYEPVHDLLYRNEGDGTFTDVSAEAGIAERAAAGMGVVCADMDGDGRMDIAVANDAYPNHLWINDGDGTFTDRAMLRGAAYNLHAQAEAGMGIVAGDLDGDLDPDLFLTHLQGESNTMYRNLGGSSGFRDETGASRLAAPSMPFTGFGAVAADVEQDGDLDLLLVNGRVIRGTPRSDAGAPAPWDELAEPNLLFLNDGAGAFARGDDAGGPFATTVEVSRGLAAGDLDGDGDLDLVVTAIGGPARIYRNDAPGAGGWLLLDVRTETGRCALGAEVTVSAGERSWRRTVRRSAGYLSSHDPRVHLGLGAAPRYERVVVRWPDGARERFDGGAVNRVVPLRRGDGEMMP